MFVFCFVSMKNKHCLKCVDLEILLIYFFASSLICKQMWKVVKMAIEVINVSSKSQLHIQPIFIPELIVTVQMPLSSLVRRGLYHSLLPPLLFKNLRIEDVFLKITSQFSCFYHSTLYALRSFTSRQVS